MQSVTRARLLAGAALGIGLTALAPQQALAQCVVTGTTLTCGNTVTTDTFYPTNVPNDRGYIFTLGLTNVDVTTGSTVSGNGLLFGNNITTQPLITIVNDGTIQLDAANNPSLADAALYLDSFDGN